jgi:hypothetical protein
LGLQVQAQLELQLNGQLELQQELQLNGRELPAA